MKILQLFLVFWIAYSSSAHNPECQPQESTTHYEEVLLVYVLNQAHTISGSEQVAAYTMKQMACSTPIDENIHTYILESAAGGISENVTRNYFYNSAVLAKNFERLFVNGFTTGRHNNECELIRKFLQQQVVKTYKNVKFIVSQINIATCSGTELDGKLIPLVIKHFSDNIVFVHSEGSALINSSGKFHHYTLKKMSFPAKIAPKFLVEASRAIIKEALIENPPGFINMHKSSLITAALGIGVNLAVLIFLDLLTGKVLEARKSLQQPGNKTKKSSIFSRSRGSKTSEDGSKTPVKEAPKKKIKAKPKANKNKC